MHQSSRKYLILFVSWVGFIFLLTSIPAAGGISPFPYFDKFAHFTVYLIAGFFFSRFLKEEGKEKQIVLLITVLVISLIGGADEIHQRWISGRVSSVYDWMADLAGGTMGALITLTLTRMKERVALYKK